jgi:hypothetical protein
MPSQDPRAAKLDSLNARIRESSGTPDPTLYHQLGDVYGDMGDSSQALRAYGQAIDGFLASGRVQVAMAVCTKVLRRYLNVTRTHFTAACISFYLGRVPDALRSLNAYAKAALKSQSTGIAIPRLRTLANLFTDRTLRQELGSLLAQLGDDEAERVRSGDPPASASTLTDAQRGEMMLQLARSGPDQMWAGWLPS